MQRRRNHVQALERYPAGSSSRKGGQGVFSLLFGRGVIGRVNFLLTFPVLWEAYRAGHVALNGAEKNSVFYGIDGQAGGVLGPYSVLLVVCAVLVVAVLLRIGSRRYPSTKQDKRSEVEH
ncbi:MAG: hypothetical protein M3R15_18445 [Acidobacteriota bacterium]|nr:hypothetical protein [Acidobacteriota bacterium]